MNLEPSTTIRDLAREIPGATRVFEKAGIDYCCGGQRSLADACATAGVMVEDMMSSLKLANEAEQPADEPNFFSATLAELVNHIIDKHHFFRRNEIPRLRGLIDKVCATHADNHPKLMRLRLLFESLSTELEPHMMKEERILFPYIIGMENSVRNQRPMNTPRFVTVATPVRMMLLEHENAGQLLKEMRQLTSDYTCPPDACITYETLYKALDAFEKDLHKHIHLENNVLFPRAVEMEGAVLSNA